MIYFILFLNNTFGFSIKNNELIRDEIRDLLITVKTTQTNHKTRMKLLQDTWSPQAIKNVSFIVTVLL